MVRPLFLKIFLWFWLAMALMVGAFVVANQMAQSDPMAEPWQKMTGNVATAYAYIATDVFERDGQAGLLDYLKRLEEGTRIRAVLFDRQGHELSGRVAPPAVKELLARAQQSGKSEFKVISRNAFAVHQMFAAPGDDYILVGEMRRSRFDPLLINPRRLAMRLVAVLLMAGVVCYGLARYLTAPITKLRAATQQLAGGDLTARIPATVRKRGDELSDLGRDFDRMAERLQAMVGAQRTLLSDISHELRSPLARLNVALGLARQRAGAEANGALDRIEREAERLNILIGQILTLVRLESGAEEPEKAPVDLAHLVNEVAADADFEARSQNRAVRVTASEACQTIGTAELLHSAIENIVRNAVRYTAEGTAVEVALGCQRNSAEAHAVIRVRDHGPGVPEKALSHLFRPFYRVADARDRQTGGTGLGLAITERAVRVHGGRVTAANAPDGGLLIEIHLPAAAKNP